MAQISSRFIEVEAAVVGLTTKAWSFQPAIFDAGNLLYEHSGVVSAVRTDTTGLFCIGDPVNSKGIGCLGKYPHPGRISEETEH